MKENDFKCIIGEALAGRPAVIRFDGPVTAENCNRFNDEFLFLQNYCRPSKIVVLVNSEGGSVLSGMGTFSIIQSCPIETHCVVEGLAASMGSVIWAAGSKLFMHDYSLLMIHNPFVQKGESDQQTGDMLKAFKGQLETVYTKRFGLSQDEVKAIMDGREGADGTYLSAEEAVAKGILSSDHVIETDEQIRSDVKAKLDGVIGCASIREVVAQATTKEVEEKLIEKTLAILEQKTNTNIKTMNEKELTFDAVCAQIGFATDVAVANVSSRIAELIKAETDLATVKAELDALKIEHKGKETEVENLANQLSEAQAVIKVYKDAEASEKAARIQEIVEAAVKDGKITADSKAEWIEMAQANLAIVEKTLAGITPREVISKVIAEDPANAQAAADSMKTTEDEIKAKLDAALGKEFSYRKF